MPSLGHLLQATAGAGDDAGAAKGKAALGTSAERSTDAVAGAEAKIRAWLQTIPIGNSADRGWDDSQIAQIAEFAQDHHLEGLQAEEIYKRYVEHQVERAQREEEEDGLADEDEVEVQE